MRVLRRVLILLVLATAVALVVAKRRAAGGSGADESVTEPIWPPFEPVAPEPATPEQVAAWAQPAEDDPPGPVWRAPVDGACPEGFPVKANDSSRIYHVPGGRFYDRTVPERCYPTPESAEADGYRRAKA